ncbi:hypothetical protein BGW36DRAFT_425289 [Talaromyces proteolyticus]|uniref:Zn(2)-C6 fungal-type domain-containing protein n=1 Tax=Talaromyces proteolyticus TaxID=1131652 RepID=A0AAD4KUZ0_9EURO|nr:uncharacterized protein BGW36DRAFT_425289 [Talaromyces proteolyticus]KAH8700465.1 hypothetical protein BGW36DRAFT_425289 [Talaromyces proteolyticus]
MPAKRTTQPGKQRVRTGCLTCRRRRRKCDEQKPCCANCETKGFTCKYPSKVTFVPAVNPSDVQSNGNTIRFINHTNNAPFVSHSSRGRDDLQYTPASTPGQNDISHPLTPHIEENRRHDGLTNTNDSGSLLLNQRNASISHRSGGGLLPAYTLDVETGLLRHFRYNISPCMDVGDPGSSFGLNCMISARNNRPLLASILALAAYQRSLVVSAGADEDLADSRRFRSEAENSLAVEENRFTRRLGYTFLIMQDFFSPGPSQWRKLSDYLLGSLADIIVQPTLEDDFKEPLFWMAFKVDLAASVIFSQPPQTPSFSFVQNSQPQSVRSIYQRVHFLLGETLYLIFQGRDPSDCRLDVEQAELLESSQESRPLSRWTYLWTECQKWYKALPVQVQPILEIRGLDAKQIDPSTTSSFPVLIYTTPLALVANAIYHITSLLLLNYRPRYLKTLPGPRGVTSPTWHSQSIAGIATSNESVGQWDPILIAGLLLIARGMTHKSQQLELLDQLRRITAITGISLEQEIESIKSKIHMSRRDEDEVS